MCVRPVIIYFDQIVSVSFDPETSELFLIDTVGNTPPYVIDIELKNLEISYVYGNIPLLTLHMTDCIVDAQAAKHPAVKVKGDV